DIKHISISCHSLEEIQTLLFKPQYCFLSPLFDSISKQGYNSKFHQLPDLNKLQLEIPVIGLGGITPDKVSICEKNGFSGVAVLGYIWEKPGEAVTNYLKFLE
ncbi:MAG: thiamine phosphate synthase, partial [Odoribacter sp.]|nr:thiamine phosphate synthase [Odoribacter sp.]